MTIDNARSQTFSEAFKHALKGEKAVPGKDACVCVPCRFVKWSHEEGGKRSGELTSGNFLLEGVVVQRHALFSPGTLGGSQLLDLDDDLEHLNSQPLQPPPRPFV